MIAGQKNPISGAGDVERRRVNGGPEALGGSTGRSDELLWASWEPIGHARWKGAGTKLRADGGRWKVGGRSQV